MKKFFCSAFTCFLFSFSIQIQSQCINLTASAGTNAVLETEDIYLENFSNQNGKGASGGVLDVSGCNWSIDVSAATLSDANDYFKVVNEKLEAKDVDGNCIWYSPSINIADYDDVYLSINASESGGLENTDIINSEYRVDGGPWSYFSSNGQYINDFGSMTVSQSGLSGSTVEIRVTVNVSEPSEQIRIDDINVTGKRYKETICIGATTTLGGSPSASWTGAGTPAITYEWSPAIGLSATNVANPDANPTINTTYKLVTILDDNGTTCRDSSFIYLTVSPQISIFSNHPVCVDDTLRLSETGGYATVWTWTTNGSATIIDFEDSTTQVVGMTNGEIFTVSVEDDNGCTNSENVTISVNPKPSNVTSNPYGTHCSSDAPFALAGGSPPGGYYDGPGVSDNNYDPSSAGYGSTLVTVDLMYIYTDANGCSDTAINPVNVQLAPEVELSSSFLSLPPTDPNYLSVSPSGDWSKCGNTNPTFTLDLEITNSSVVNNSANVTYDIDFGDGNSMLNISTGTVYSNTYLSQGPYDIVVTATDNISGCVRSYTKPFFFGTNPAISLGIPGNTQNQCAPRTYGFVATFSDNSGTLNSPGTMYTKYTNDGKPDSVFTHPNPATDLASGTIFHTFDDASCGYSTPFYDNSFLVGVAATNGCGSSSAEVSPITQSSPPIANMVDMDSIYCIDEPVTFSDSSLGGKYVYGANTGTGFSYECDTVDAIAWVFEPDTGFTILSGSLGTLPLDYFDSTTYGTTELVVSFHYQMTYSVKLIKNSPCGSSMASDTSMHEFKIDSFPSAEFVLDNDIGCAPLVVENTNISRSLSDYNSTFSWGSSTLISGCEGNSPPTILNTPSDSTQLEIYIETFDLQIGKGISGVNTDTSNVDWTIDVSGNAMVDANDFFAVSNIFGDPRLVARDVNNGNSANMIWYSPAVDITGFSSINLFLKARDSSAVSLEPDDTFESYYRIDGGAWTYFENNGQLSGNFGSVEVTHDSLSGSTVEIKVEMNVDEVNEYLALDSVFISGYGEYDSLNSQYTFNNPGMYGIELTATNVCGPITYVDTVIVQGPPVLTLNPIDDTCNTKTAYAISVIDTCFGNMNLYSWTFPGGDIASSNQETPPAVTYNAVGTYWIYDSVANQCGSDYDSVSFIIHENPSINLLLTDSTCIFDSVQISPTVTNGTPNYNYLWEANGGITSTSILNPYASPLVDEYYVLTVTDDNNCEDIDSILIDVQSLPIVNAGIDQNICPEDTAFLSGSIAGGISPYNHYWDLGVLSDTTILNPYYDMQGTSSFTLTASDAFGCTNSDQVIINEYVSPIVDAGDDTTICDLPISVDFDGTPAGGIWTGTNINASGELLPNGIGQEEVIYQYTDFFGCYNEDTLLVDIVDPILSNAGPNLEVCVSEGNIFLQGTPYGGFWDDPNTVSNSTSTLYEERFTGLNGRGATSSGTNLTGCNWSVDVSGASLTNGFKYLKVVSERLEARDLDGPAYWLSPSIPITNYVNVSISIAATELGSMEVDDVIESEYRIDGGAWTTFALNGSLGGNFTSATVSQDGLSGNTLEIRVKMENNSSAEYLRIDDIIVTGDISGTYSFNTPGVVNLVYIYGTGNCVNNDTTQVTIHNLPTVEAGTDTALCISDSVIISGNPIGGIWSGTGITDPTGKFLGSLAGDGDHTVYYSYVDANTCENLDSIVVTVYPLPQVNAGNDTILCNQPGIVDFDGNLVPGYWTGSNDSNCSGNALDFDGINDYIQFPNSFAQNITDFTFEAWFYKDANNSWSRILDFGSGTGVNMFLTPSIGNSGQARFAIKALGGSEQQLTSPSTISLNSWVHYAVTINNATSTGKFYINGVLVDQNNNMTYSPASLGATNANYLGKSQYIADGYLDGELDEVRFWNVVRTSTEIQSSMNSCLSGNELGLIAYYNFNSTSVNILSDNTVNGNNGNLISMDPSSDWITSGLLNNFNNNSTNYVGFSIDSSGGFEPSATGIYDIIFHHTDILGCYNNDTLSINVIDPTNADAGIDIQECVDAGTIQFVGSPLGGVWSDNGISFNGDFTPTIQDTLDFVYSYGTGNCLTRDTVNLIVNPLPNVNVLADFSVCIDDTIQVLNANVSGGIWSGTGITNVNGDFTPAVAGVGTHRINYLYIDSNACENSDSVFITVNALPIVVAPNDTNICNLPAPVNFVGSPIGGNWVGQDIDMNGLYTPNGSGVFELYYEYFDANSCYNIDTMILTVDVPQIADAGLDIQACEDTGLIQLIGLPIGAGTWDGNGVAVNGDFLVNSVDTVDLAYNIGSGNCFTTDTMNLLIHPLPVVDVDLDFEICISFGDTTLNFSPFGGFWQGQGIIDTALGTFSPTTAGIGTHRLLYSYQHPITACWNYDSLDVTVSPLPIISYDHDTIFCLNVGHQITNSTTGASFHYWSISEGSLSNDQSPVFSLDTVGVFDINYVAETDRGCLDSLSSLVEVIAPPVATYMAPDSGCGPWIVDFTNNSVGTYISYLWDLGFDNISGGDSTTTDTVPPTQTYAAGIYFDTTYYTTLTVSNVCGLDTDSLEITSMPQPVSLFGPSTNVGGCLSGTITFANNSYGLPDSFWWDFGDGNIGNNSDTLFDHYYVPGMSNQFYTVTMAVTNECGTDTSQSTVTILPSSLVAFFTVDTTIGCVPFTVDFQQLSVGGTTTSWDFDDGNFSNIYSPTHTFVNPGTYDVMLAVSNACNYDTLYKTITVNSSPQVSFSVVDDTLCAGSTFTFNNSSDLGISNYWDFGDGSDSYLTNPTHIYNSAGNFSVVLTGTSLTNDCPAYDSVSLVVLPYPDVTGTSDINNGCIPLTVNFSNTVNSIGYFTWDFGDGNTSSQSNPTHTYTTDGYFNVFVRFEDLSGCVDSFDFDVNPYPVPQAGFSINQLDTCELPANFDFSNSSVGAVNYTWSFGDGSNQTSQTNPSHTYLVDGSYDVMLHVSNTYGCVDSIVNSISINPVPVASFNTLQLDTCVLPASFSFNNSSNGAVAYTWDFGDGSTSNIPSLTYNYTSAGTYNVKLYSMNTFGCMDSANTTVSVLPVPDVSFNFTKYDSCILPSNYGFTNTSSGASSYLWSFGQLGNSIQNNPTFTFTNDGTYEVKLIGLNSYGCIDSMISYINVLPIPNADFVLNQAVGCEPFSPVFLNTSQNTNYYNWDFGDGNTGSFFHGFHTYTNAGSYTIKLVVEDLYGCLDSTYSNVTVNPSPTADLTYVTSDPCYLPIDVFFTNQSVGAISFEWDFGNGQSSTTTHPSTVYDTIGIYNLQLIASNSYNCTDTLNEPFSVFYNQVPNANFTFDDTICLRDTSLFNSTSLFADSIVWNLGNGIQTTGDSIAMVYDTPGQYTITMYAYNTGSGCSDTAGGNSTLVVLPSPIADFEYNQEFSSTQPRSGIIEFTNFSVGAIDYTWDWGNGETTNNPNPTYNYSYSEDGTYTYVLYALNYEGCLDSALLEFVVNFRKALFVPNAMYVGDPDYEVSHFVPKGTGLETYHIEIFDTFGNVIWESDALDDEGKPTGAWDGTFKGITVEQDVYVWKVEATYKDETPWEGKYYQDENILRKTGTVTVIR